MPSESLITEFVSLISDTREQLAYLHELGVIHVETESQAPSSTKKAIVAEPKDIHAQVLSDSFGLPGQELSTSTSAASVASVSDRGRQSAVTSLPQDTLFGDIAAPPPIIEKSSESFEQIWSDIGDCTRCPLHQRRTNIVHTEGNRRARLMFVGEAPGADEDLQARPFVGRAGQLLTKIIEAIGFKREDVLIGNVNRCRPPGNRPPTSEEASMCKPFLLREIAAVQPEVIVVLGNTAMRNLLDIKQGITRVRGQFQDYHGVKVMPTFHPAYLLRDPSKKQETWQDLKKVRDYLETTPRRES
jgi:uracil-DNA glycosylase family 4